MRGCRPRSGFVHDPQHQQWKAKKLFCVRVPVRNGSIDGVLVYTKKRDLASSDKPFICPSCSLAEHRLLITTLLETVQSLKEEIKQPKGERLVQLSAKNSNSEASYQVSSEAPFESLPTPQENKSEPWYNVTRKDKRDGKGRERNTKM